MRAADPHSFDLGCVVLSQGRLHPHFIPPSWVNFFLRESWDQLESLQIVPLTIVVQSFAQLVSYRFLFRRETDIEMEDE